MRTRRHAVSLALAWGLLSAGCGGEKTAACTNEASGYRVQYPADWYTNKGDPTEPCSFFHSEPFEVPEGTEFLDVGALVGREPVPFDVVAGEDPSRTVLEEEETEIAGNRAVRLESEATGEGLLDRGTRFYEVIVEVDGESLIVSTFDLGDLDYERNKEVVDEIAAGLELLR